MTEAEAGDDGMGGVEIAEDEARRGGYGGIADSPEIVWTAGRAADVVMGGSQMSEKGGQGSWRRDVEKEVREADRGAGECGRVGFVR